MLINVKHTMCCRFVCCNALKTHKCGLLGKEVVLISLISTKHFLYSLILLDHKKTFCNQQRSSTNNCCKYITVDKADKELLEEHEMQKIKINASTSKPFSNKQGFSQGSPHPTLCNTKLFASAWCLLLQLVYYNNLSINTHYFFLT